MASNGSDAAYHEPATTWRVARDLAEQAGRGMNQRRQPAAQGARSLCMQQLTVVSLVFALFMMDALRTAGVLPCSVSIAMVLCALGGALIAFIAEAIEASASSTSLSAAV